MASKISIISLFIVLLATFCYSKPVEEITPKPDQSVLTDVTTATQEAKANMFLVSEKEAVNLPDIRKKRSIEDSGNEESSTQGQSEAVTRSSNPSEEGNDDGFTTAESVTRPSRDFISKETGIISSNPSTLNKTEDKQTLNGSPSIFHDNNTKFEPRVLSGPSTSPNPSDYFNESVWGESQTTKPTSRKDKKPQTTTTPETEYQERAFEDTATQDKPILNDSPFTIHDNSTKSVMSPNSPDHSNQSKREESPITEPTSGEDKQPQTATSETAYQERALEDTTTQDKPTLNGSPFIVHDNNTKSVMSPNSPDDFSEAKRGESSITEPTSDKDKQPQTTPTSETAYQERAFEDITTQETLLTTSSSNNLQHLTYSEIIIPGDVKLTTLNGTGSREHVLNQLSRGEKYSIVHQP